MEYISREVLIEEIEEEIEAENSFKDGEKLITKGLKIALRDIKKQKPADVRLVKYGEWIPYDDISPDYWRCCSNCYHLEKRDYKRFKFCPNCGADMRGDTNE